MPTQTHDHLPLVRRDGADGAVRRWRRAAIPGLVALRGEIVPPAEQPDEVPDPDGFWRPRDRGFGSAVPARNEPAGNGPPKDRYAFPYPALAAAEWLRGPDGPRIAALELGGQDSRTDQPHRLEALSGQLDAGLLALRTGLVRPAGRRRWRC
nr:hypothetical protein [uncultured Rhodopila sp.]